jgi:DNA-binding beta-propeller fold protein YncE
VIPDGGRVLVHDMDGNCVGSFGQSGTDIESLTTGQLVVVGGLSTDEQGNVYVVDSGANRVLRFAPFTLPEDAMLPDGQVAEDESSGEVELSFDEEDIPDESENDAVGESGSGSGGNAAEEDGDSFSSETGE